MLKADPNGIAAADALKYFAKSAIEVQTARPVSVKGEDGKERPTFKTEMKPLAEQHVIAARDYGEKVVIVTIDGRRYEQAKKAA